MNYFVDRNLGNTITGIEKAEFNRLNFFKKSNIPAKIIYLRYNNGIHKYMKKFGIQDDGFSMYDYFQKSIDQAEQEAKDWPSFWKKDCEYSLQYSDKYPDIRATDKDGKVALYAGFFDNSYSRVRYINYFDKDHNKIQTDMYDSRGFLSCSYFLAENSLIQSEVYFDPEGKVRIIRQNLISGDRTFTRNITLTDYKGKTYLFSNDEELQTFFLNELYKNGDVFYSDRSEFFSKVFDNTKPEVKVVAVIHSTHVRSGEDILTGTMKRGVYDYVLTHPAHLAGIICSTEQQKKDILERFDNLPPVTVIPVGSAVHHRVKIKKRNFHRIICVARLAPEKQLMHQVKAIEKLIPEFPDVELNLFGSGSKVEAQIRSYIADHHLEKNVLLKGFRSKLDAEYAKSSLLLQTSVEEGFSLSAIEALSFDVPVIGYNINYGPSEMIVDGKNGFLVPANDQEILYKKMRTYLRNQELQKKFMKNCSAVVKKYSPRKVQRKWEEFNRSLMN